MNYSDKLALIREYKNQGGKGSYLSLLQSYAEGGNLPLVVPEASNKSYEQWPSHQAIQNTQSLINSLNTSSNEVNNSYKVKSGDTISKIAVEHGIDIPTIKRLNPGLKDINKIFPNQEIVTNKKIITAPPKEIDYRYKTPFELDVVNSSLSNEEKIKLYESVTPSGDFYVIEDKKNHVVNVMNYKGDVIESYNSVSGRNKGDALTITYTGGTGKIKDGAGNLSTPSGMFRITGSGKYHGSPSFTRGKINEDYDIASSVHKRTVPNDKSKCNTSNGCTGLSESSLAAISKYVGKNTRWYILPEEEDSGEFKITGTGLSFISNNLDKLFSEHSKGTRNIEIIPPNELSENINVTAAINTLQQEKPKFIDKLKVSSDTYDRLAVLALGIMGRESSYGEPGIRGTVGFLRDDLGAAMGKNVSAGNYQLRATSVPKEMIKKVLGKSSLTYEDLTNTTISTQAVMTTLYDIYKNIAPRYKNKYPDMTLDEITLAYYTNPQGVINPEKSELRKTYAKTVKENASRFKINYDLSV